MKLGNLCDVVRGSSPRPQGDSLYYGGSIPRLMIADVTRDGVYVTPQIDFLTEEGAKKSRPMKKGDIIIAVSGDPGKPCILNVDACIHDGFVGLRDLDESKIFKPYLIYYLIFFKYQTQKNAVGAIFQNLTTVQIKNIYIPEITLKDQIRVATILGKVESIIKKREANIKLLEEYLKSTFIKMFGDPLKNEKGWRVINLKKSCTKIGSGATPKGGEENYKAKGISLIRSLNVHNNQFEFKDLAFIDDKQASDLKNVIVEKNDILLNITGASVARCCLVPVDVLPARVNQHVSILRPANNLINPIFLNWALTNESYQFFLINKSKSKGATREALTKKDIELLKVPIPSLKIQNHFALIVSKIETIKKQYIASLFELESLYSSLSQRAFTGEIDLSKIEANLEIDSILSLKLKDNEPNLNKPLVKQEQESPKDTRQSTWLFIRSLDNGSNIEFNETEGQTVMEHVFSKKNEGFSFGEFEAFLKKEKFSFTFPQVADFIFQLIEDKQISQHFDSKEGMRSKKRIDKDNEPEFIENGSIWFRYKPAEKRK